jgi:hypothetical protein
MYALLGGPSARVLENQNKTVPLVLPKLGPRSVDQHFSPGGEWRTPDGPLTAARVLEN